ncbi:centromere protein W isoform X1 [Anser cygnoides]|uniref:centromere protein W isoform X1 n=1 Tax=Anser cygnoides TaxID=8845 RepID=UPI0034D2CA75
MATRERRFNGGGGGGGGGAAPGRAAGKCVTAGARLRRGGGFEAVRGCGGRDEARRAPRHPARRPEETQAPAAPGRQRGPAGEGGAGALIHLNFLMFLHRLAEEARTNAFENKSKTIKPEHTVAAAKVILKRSRG